MMNVKKVLDAAIKEHKIDGYQAWSMFEEAFALIHDLHDTTKWSDDKLERAMIRHICAPRSE